jgi:hypothetical protein
LVQVPKKLKNQDSDFKNEEVFCKKIDSKT